MTDQPNPADNPETAALVKTGIDQVLKGKIVLGDLFQSVLSPQPPAAPDKTPPRTPALPQDVLDAIKRLPEVFGQTVVNTDRALTKPEAQALVEERSIIDLVLGALGKRKDEGIREALANHADAVLPEDQRVRQDRKGHWAPYDTQNIPVDGTGKKIQRFASGGKPNLTIQGVQDLYDSGVITRKEYLAITRKPDSPRVLDENGLAQAVKKDPRLFFLLASKAEPTFPTTTIKVVPDK